jgi:cell division protease FtsH
MDSFPFGQAEQDGQNPDGGKPEKPKWVNLLILWFIIIFVLNLIVGMFARVRQIEIDYSQFIKLVEGGFVNRVQLGGDQILISLKQDVDDDAVLATLFPVISENEYFRNRVRGTRLYSTGRIEDPDLNRRLLDQGIAFGKPIVRTNPIISFLSSWIVPLIIIYVIYSFLFRKLSGGMGLGGMMNVGKSKAKLYSMEEKTGVSFASVAGQDEAKESLREMVDFLNHPEKYREIGAKQPKGALLVGPPGTGKTLLAKAVAGEAAVPFFSLSGSEFIEMFVGVGASRVRDLFEQAAKHAPCIVFIDEIDAIGKSRNGQFGGNDEREQTLNQLLAEMDGFDSASKAIIILAATNRPEVLDQALLRPGRFDRQIIVEKPDLPGREAILAVHAAKIKLDEGIDLREIALMTSGAAGADLANIINEGALRAVRLGRQTVSQEDLVEAVETVVAGKEKKDRILSEKEKRMVAYHEVGHALVSALQRNAVPVQKITIVPRTMGALGYTMQTPEEDRYLQTKGELLAQITVLLGGRVAEEIEFGERSTGASNDIERATKIARGMVTQYGMSDRFGMMSLESPKNQYLDGRNVLTCSDETGSGIDEEVRKILDDCYAGAKNLLSANHESLRRIAEKLFTEETITGTRFMELLKG